MSHRCDKTGRKVKRPGHIFRAKKPTPLEALSAREVERATKEGSLRAGGTCSCCGEGILFWSEKEHMWVCDNVGGCYYGRSPDVEEDADGD